MPPASPISESEVCELVDSIPYTSFINSYIRHAIAQTDAPIVFHLGTALAILGAWEEGLRHGPTRTQGPFWSMLVGGSADSRKTTAIDLASRFLETLPLQHAESRAAAIEDLSDHGGKGIYVYGEFGDFLARTHQNQAYGPLREYFTSLWDCRPISKMKVSSKKDPSGSNLTVVDNPRVSFLAGSTVTFIEAYTNATDWSGGWMNRWSVFAGMRERNYVLPRSEDSNLTGDAATALSRVREYPAAGFTGPGYQGSGFSEEALERYQAWYTEWNLAKKDKPIWIQEAIARVPDTARKAALLMARDLGEASGSGWVLSLKAIHFGIGVAEFHSRSAEWLVGRLGSSVYDRRRRAVLDVLDIPRTEGQILSRLHPAIDRRDLRRVLESMAEEELIFRDVSKGDNRWTTERPQIGLVLPPPAAAGLSLAALGNRDEDLD